MPVVAGAEGWRPELTATLGGTFAVQGTPDEGGSSASLAALWPLGDGLSVGLMLHADDAGASVDSLRDEQGQGLPYGTVEQAHRFAWGASWRVDASAPPWRLLTPFASVTWGYYRITDDLRGSELGAVSSAGFSLGAGVRRPFGAHIVLGAEVRYHRLFNDRAGRFASASLIGCWR
jgi:hypothetical protein